jgi:CubicO group peptidase (beta-lactamase class C family)
MKTLLHSLSLVSTLALLLTSAAGITADDISAMIEKNLAEYRVPGAVVVVVEDGKITHLQGYGIRDIETKTPVDADTIFQLASVTKTFAAATYGAAVDAKAVDWDQPVHEVFPAFRLHCPYATKWTNGIDLLVHRTGLPPFVGALYEALGFNREEILERIPLIQPNVSFRETAQYSNIGFFLAGESAAAAMKTTWPALLQEKILDPLKMKRTGMVDTISPKDENTALPYALDGANGWRAVVPDTQPVLLAAGAMASTGRDMASYLQMLLAQGRFQDAVVLSPDAVEKMFTPVVATEPGFAEMAPIGVSTGFSYTPGWGIFYYNGERVVEKGGALAGYRALICLVPDRNWGLAILSNLNFTAFPEAVRAALIEKKLGGIPGRDFAAEIRSQWERIGELTAPPPLPENPRPASLPLAAYRGIYSSLALGMFEITDRNGTLHVLAGPAHLRGELTHYDGEKFLCQWAGENSGVEDFDFLIQGEAVSGFVFDGEYAFTRHGDSMKNPKKSE